MNKDVHLLVRTLRRRGYGIERGGSGHLLVLSPAGKQVWTLPSSPSDHRWYTNTVRDLIRAGLIDEDPRGSGRRKPARGKRDTGGQSPPPLPDLSFPDRKDPVPSTSHQITVDLIDKSTLIFQTLQAQYDLKMRKGRLTPHGGVPILTEIMLAYEQETGKAIPNFNYNSVLSKYDANDRREMARLAANRISDILTKKVGAALSKVGQDSILYGERAMAWFEDRGFTFPNGQTLEVGGYHGVEVVRVDDGVGVEDEALAQEAMAEMGIGPANEAFIASGTTGEKYLPSPVEYLTPPGFAADAIADKFVDNLQHTIDEYRNGSVDRERALLAIEIAAKTGDAELAARVL